jgi:hypothetical protein
MSAKVPPYETFTRPTCRGSVVLGNHCKRCEKCEWERRQSAPATPAEPEISQHAARALLAALKQSRTMIELLCDGLNIDPAETSLTVVGRHRDTGATRDLAEVTVQQSFDEADAAIAAAEGRTA